MSEEKKERNKEGQREREREIVDNSSSVSVASIGYRVSRLGRDRDL